MKTENSKLNNPQEYPSFEMKKKECFNNFIETFKETQSENSEDWRNCPFCNIVFDKKAVSKETFHNHLIRTYEGLNHANTLNFLMTTEMINGKGVELKRRGKSLNF